MTYSAVIFDLDGTLLDTKEDVGDAMNRVLEELGLPTYSPEIYAGFIGSGARALVVRTLPDEWREEATIETALDAFRADYDCNWNVKTKPYEGIPELLDELTARGIKMAVLSNKPHEITIEVVSELLPSWEFDVVFGMRDEVPPKPNPTSAHEVAQILGLPEAEILFVGDTVFDMETAIRAGMYPLGVAWGFRTVEDLESDGAEAILSHPLELLVYLD